MKSERFKKAYQYSLALNVVLITGALIVMTFFIQRRQTLKQKHKTYLETYHYSFNSIYVKKTSLYSLYTRQRNIVMLGSSLTGDANWDELLDRPDVANRGIGGDMSEGILSRMEYVLNVNPEICFIELGINDVAKKVSDEAIINNLTEIVDLLMGNNIIPVINTIAYITAEKDTRVNGTWNHHIKILNEKFIQLAKDKQIPWIDLNAYISENDNLIPEFATKDGLHFSDKTYEIWKREVKKVLALNGI